MKLDLLEKGIEIMATIKKAWIFLNKTLSGGNRNPSTASAVKVAPVSSLFLIEGYHLNKAEEATREMFDGIKEMEEFRRNLWNRR